VESRNSFPCFLFVRVFSDARPSRSACWWQELERRARERYVALDRLDADFHWYRGQYEALDALVEALRSPDRWLAYRAEALLDLPRSRAPRTRKAPPRSRGYVRRWWSKTMHCARLARTWRGVLPHVDMGGGGRPPAPSSNRVVRRSRRLRG
jgi:hypothetical protein